MPKLTLDELFEQHQERIVRRHEISAPALRREVWVAQTGLPGMPPDSQTMHRTKPAAIGRCVEVSAGEAGTLAAPRGLRAALHREGLAEIDGYQYRVKRVQVADLFTT